MIESIVTRVALAGLLLALGVSVPAAEAGDKAVKEVVREAECGSVELPIIGEVERVVLEPGGAVLEARVDSGATTSSIDARDIEAYEKDGKPWVRFNVPMGEGDPQAYDLAVVRTASIKRHGAEPIERPVVELTVRLGDMAEASEFSLTDRGDFDFPVLLGRNFLKARFLVNVARKHQLKTKPLAKSAKGKAK